MECLLQVPHSHQYLMESSVTQRIRNGFWDASRSGLSNPKSMVAKGKSLGFTQVFHGENAGTIDKFYSNALARAIGFTTVFDPVFRASRG